MEYSNINKENWDSRSADHKSDMRSVLFKSFPDSLNKHIHTLHTKFILKNIPDKANITILDAGCGYGRNSLSLIKRNRNISIEGIDLSQTFVDLYKANVNELAQIGTLEKFPEGMGKFDYIICVTVLMYVKKDQIDIALKNMLSHLKEGGEIILIEPLKSGLWFSSGFGILGLFQNKQAQKTEYCFSSKELRKFIEMNGGKILHEDRIPITTIFILPLYLLAVLFSGKILQPVYRITGKFDSLFSNFKLPSLYTSLTICNNL